MLYYRCNRMLVEVLEADTPVVRPLSLPKRHIYLREVSRHTAPRPHDVSEDRRRLQKLPLFLYNSAPEAKVIKEFKDKVSYVSLSIVNLWTSSSQTLLMC